MFNRILVPLDGSLLSEQALGPAAAIARASDAEIHVVCVHQPMTVGAFVDAPWNADIWKEEHAYVDSIATELISGAKLNAGHAMLTGDPAEMICAEARNHGADLIVMTSHGRTGLSRVWMGSVADRVVRHSTVPVLMVRPIDSKTRLREAHHLAKRILVPLDGSELSDSIIPPAVAFAKASGGSLTLLRVVPPVPLVSPEAGIPYAGVPFVYVVPIRDDKATLQVVDDVKRQMVSVGERLRRERGVEVKIEVVVAEHVASAILDFAAEHGDQLIALATRGHGVSRFFLGSVADKLLRSSGLPLLVIRPVTPKELAEQHPEIEAALAGD